MNLLNQKIELVHLDYRTLKFFQGDLKKMAEIVQKQLESGVNMDEICKSFGMESEEVIRLANRQGIPKASVIQQNTFGKAWEPN